MRLPILTGDKMMIKSQFSEYVSVDNGDNPLAVRLGSHIPVTIGIGRPSGKYGFGLTSLIASIRVRQGGGYLRRAEFCKIDNTLTNDNTGVLGAPGEVGREPIRSRPLNYIWW